MHLYDTHTVGRGSETSRVPQCGARKRGLRCGDQVVAKYVFARQRKAAKDFATTFAPSPPSSEAFRYLRCCRFADSERKLRRGESASYRRDGGPSEFRYRANETANLASPRRRKATPRHGKPTSQAANKN